MPVVRWLAWPSEIEFDAPRERQRFDRLGNAFGAMIDGDGFRQSCLADRVFERAHGRLTREV